MTLKSDILRKIFCEDKIGLSSPPPRRPRTRKIIPTAPNFSVRLLLWMIEVFTPLTQNRQGILDMLLEHKVCTNRQSLPWGSSGYHLRARAQRACYWTIETTAAIHSVGALGLGVMGGLGRGGGQRNFLIDEYAITYLKRARRRL